MNRSTPLFREDAAAQAEWLKDNALRMAEHHHRTCDGDSCAVSMLALRLLLERAGYELTDEEKALLW